MGYSVLKCNRSKTVLGDICEVVGSSTGVLQDPVDGQFQVLCRSFERLPSCSRFTRENIHAIKGHLDESNQGVCRLRRQGLRRNDAPSVPERREKGIKNCRQNARKLRIIRRTSGIITRESGAKKVAKSVANCSAFEFSGFKNP